MKGFKFIQGCAALVGLVAMLGLSGCDEVLDDSPDSISGVWSGTLTRSGDATLHETWVFQQDGETVWGTYTFKGDTYSFAGTYDDDKGEFRGTDSDHWTLSLDFDEEDEGDGTIAGVSGSTGTYQIWNVALSR